MIYNNNDIIICENCKTHIEDIKAGGFFDDKSLKLLKNPNKILTVNYPVRMDNGDIELITGFRVQYNNALGPTKGGIRFHESVDLSDVTELAFLMSLKTSLAQIPYGGAKGGIKINPKELSEGELERVTREYVREMFKIIGPDQDIPAPDVNTNPKIMGWMVDEYERFAGRKTFASFTGKPILLGGSLGRDKATARGGFYIIEEKYKDIDKSNLNVAVMGFGNAGSHIAKMLSEIGFKIIAVSDSTAAIYNKDGFDIDDLIEFKRKASFKDFDAEKITYLDLTALNLEILVPASLGGVINDVNVDLIRAKVILELANSPVTTKADNLLFKRGVEIIPDILANSGGVIVSYFEWVQNLQAYPWSELEVNSKLQEKMLTNYKDVLKFAKNTDISLRKSSYVLSMKRILEAERLRGHLS